MEPRSALQLDGTAAARSFRPLRQPFAQVVAASPRAQSAGNTVGLCHGKETTLASWFLSALSRHRRGSHGTKGVPWLLWLVGSRSGEKNLPRAKGHGLCP